MGDVMTGPTGPTGSVRPLVKTDGARCRCINFRVDEYGQGWCCNGARQREDVPLEEALVPKPAPIPMLLTCPTCGARHVDTGVFATKPHHTHACQSCGMCWRPAIVDTVGVQFLPGFRNAAD